MKTTVNFRIVWKYMVPTIYTAVFMVEWNFDFGTFLNAYDNESINLKKNMLLYTS